MSEPLTEERKAELWAEHDRLRKQRDELGRRLNEICDVLLADLLGKDVR
jgi:hypothetical protein